MQAIKLLKILALLFIMLHGSPVSVLSQNILWMKGQWKEYSGTPYKVPPVKCINTLQVTAAADSIYTAIQTTYFAKDTTIRIMHACNGLLTQNKKQFYRGDLVYKNNSSHKGYDWSDCSHCMASTCSLYVEHNKIIWLIATNNCDSACNGIIAYYRVFDDFDSTTKQQLLSLYTMPQYNSLLTSSMFTSSNTRTKDIALPEQNDSMEIDLSASNKALPPMLSQRKNKLAQTLQITSPNIEVILLDDAEIDGDIVSLYHNNVEVLSHKTLGKEVIKYSFKADKQHAYNELILVAESLGSIPPNTALMRIRAGDKKYELTTRANLQENAKVIIEYTGK